MRQSASLQYRRIYSCKLRNLPYYVLSNVNDICLCVYEIVEVLKIGIIKHVVWVRNSARTQQPTARVT